MLVSAGDLEQLLERWFAPTCSTSRPVCITFTSVFHRVSLSFHVNHHFGVLPRHFLALGSVSLPSVFSFSILLTFMAHSLFPLSSLVSNFTACLFPAFRSTTRFLQQHRLPDAQTANSTSFPPSCFLLKPNVHYRDSKSCRCIIMSAYRQV